jgi:hypothetical protein
MLRLYLWAKYAGAQGLPMMPRDIHIITKDEGGIGFIDVVTQERIHVAKWVVRFLDGSSPLKILFMHKLHIA